MDCWIEVLAVTAGLLRLKLASRWTLGVGVAVGIDTRGRGKRQARQGEKKSQTQNHVCQPPLIAHRHRPSDLVGKAD
jgi:hypothetical protein